MSHENYRGINTLRLYISTFDVNFTHANLHTDSEFFPYSGSGGSDTIEIAIQLMMGPGMETDRMYATPVGGYNGPIYDFIFPKHTTTIYGLP